MFKHELSANSTVLLRKFSSTSNISISYIPAQQHVKVFQCTRYVAPPGEGRPAWAITYSEPHYASNYCTVQNLIVSLPLPYSTSVYVLNYFMPQNLVIASFFQERVETVKLASGGTAFIQRPKAKTEGSVQSAGDLPDDFDIGHIVANTAQIYRISIGPIDVSLPYPSGVLHLHLYCISLISNLLKYMYRLSSTSTQSTSA